MLMNKSSSLASGQFLLLETLMKALMKEEGVYAHPQEGIQPDV